MGGRSRSEKLSWTKANKAERGEGAKNDGGGSAGGWGARGPARMRVLKKTAHDVFIVEGPSFGGKMSVALKEPAIISPGRVICWAPRPPSEEILGIVGEVPSGDPGLGVFVYATRHGRLLAELTDPPTQIITVCSRQLGSSRTAVPAEPSPVAARTSSQTHSSTRKTLARSLRSLVSFFFSPFFIRTFTSRLFTRFFVFPSH